MTVNSSMISNDVVPPFLPLEETIDSEREDLLLKGKKKQDSMNRIKSQQGHSAAGGSSTKIKRFIGAFFTFVVLFLLYDTIFTAPEQRFIKPDASDRFLRWVQHHPLQGIVAFMLVIGVSVVLLLPVGTPLTIGCGFVYKTAYGWKVGFLIATTVSMMGSAAGACTCFILGRYLLRDHVRTYVRKNPLLEAIDTGTFILNFAAWFNEFYWVLLVVLVCCQIGYMS